ncbi:RnfH family protein [Pseudoalteromonas peptidolytica]|uniref:RnfH family protein n=1 Tax=Pseudoalteromonas peptidolytica TaxID=61150 RepID=UPI00298E581F|nr:RnfH family protein [Pseudoalteromonas peptidolytica]MDW7548043.1 RnfH family protein [Pseudoalteromonas peptidolytica]
MIKVEVVFALPDKATSVSVDVPEGTSAEQAVLQSGILDKCPEVDANNLTLGVWNRTVKLHQVVNDGDRIEIYRPLIADPKEARRRRAEKAKEEGRASKITGGRPTTPGNNTN